MDVKADFGKYTSGSCRWQEAVEILEKANRLDKANMFPGDNYGLWWVYQVRGNYEKALKIVNELQQHTWIWWHMLTSIANHELNNNLSASEGFIKVEKMLDSNSLDSVYKLYTHWRVEEYWLFHGKFIKNTTSSKILDRMS